MCHSDGCPREDMHQKLASSRHVTHCTTSTHPVQRPHPACDTDKIEPQPPKRSLLQP